ncbi:MAG: hypothetical protein IPJ74_08535 [Saprospiraceae bacterium]|nr:hypothetical protein [Saprospiraceae bacterium]
MRNILSILIFLFIVFSLGCQTNKVFNKPPVNFGELWKADTCGIKGYRAFVVQYIDENKYHVLEGKSIEYIEYHFGKPDIETFTKEWNIIHYSYNCSALEIREDGRCGVPTNTSYYININAKTKTVIDAVMRIHN